MGSVVAERAVPLDEIRAYARERLEAESIRQLAADVGMVPNALGYFLEGGEPRTRNRAKLEHWYLRAVSEDAAMAIHVLVRPLPVHERKAAADEIRDVVVSIFTRVGKPSPFDL